MHTQARGPRCRKSSRPTFRACLALAGTLSAGSAFAANGPGILYGPAGAGGPAEVAAIPTLGGIAMLLLGAFMLFVFWRMHRNGNFAGGRFMAIALVSGSMVSGLGGVRLMSSAIANGPVVEPVLLANPNGGFEPFQPTDEGGQQSCVINDTTVPLRVIDMPELFGVGDCPDGEGGFKVSQLCEVNLILQPGDECGASTGFTASDLRLKTDIVQVGVAANGLPLYEFRYLDGATRYRGVMAQDVLQHTPAAVRMRADGYMAVDYGMLGLEMTPVR